MLWSYKQTSGPQERPWVIPCRWQLMELEAERQSAAQGVKVGDLQATAQGFLSAYMFFVISNGKPLDRLSRERPHPSIFCAYVFLSVVGQFVLHMSFLIYMYYVALKSMPEVSSQVTNVVYGFCRDVSASLHFFDCYRSKLPQEYIISPDDAKSPVW